MNSWLEMDRCCIDGVLQKSCVFDRGDTERERESRGIGKKRSVQTSRRNDLFDHRAVFHVWSYEIQECLNMIGIRFTYIGFEFWSSEALKFHNFRLYLEQQMHRELVAQ